MSCDRWRYIIGLPVNSLTIGVMKSEIRLGKAQKEAARLRFQSHAGAISLGYATGADNESIDAELVKA